MNKGIACPDCGETKSEVTDSRPNGVTTRRRRRCLGCDRRYTTYETVEKVSNEGVVSLTGLPLHIRAAIRLLIRGERK